MSKYVKKNMSASVHLDLTVFYFSIMLVNQSYGFFCFNRVTRHRLPNVFFESDIYN